MAHRVVIFATAQLSCNKLELTLSLQIGRFVLQANMHQLTKSDVWFDVIRSRWRTWRWVDDVILSTEKCCHLVHKHAPSTRRICSSISTQVVHFLKRSQSLQREEQEQAEQRYEISSWYTRKPCYRKENRAMRPIYGCPEKYRKSLATPTATFPEIVNGLLL